MENASERRRTPRLFVNLPVTYEVLPSREPEMPKDLAEVYERVHAATELAGKKLEGVIRDLSINGSFINGPPVPLLARVAVTFPLPGIPGWRGSAGRCGGAPGTASSSACCRGDLARPADPPEGFGILFESITADARRHIDRLIRMHESSRAIMQSGS